MTAPTAPVPFAPSLTRRIAEVATRCLARLARLGRGAEVHRRRAQQRADAAAQAAAREVRR